MAEVSPGQDATAAQHNALYAARCPSGMIAMWSGILATIPTGWYLCDGDNSTPNLLDRFILSVPNASTNPGTTGGAHTKTIATANLPSHRHTISSDGAHRHYVTGWKSQYGGGSEVGYGDEGGSNRDTSLSGAHSHGGNTGYAGSGSALDIRPKYFSLAYIMKS